MARPRVNLTPAQLDEAARRIKIGVPTADVAAELGTNRRTLERKLAAFQPEADEVDDDDEADDRQAAKDAAALGLGGLTHDELKERASTVARSQAKIAEELEAQGEIEQSRKARDLELKAIGVLRALEKQRPANEVVVTKEQLIDAEREALATLQRYSEARPQLCAHCSRALSLAWSEGKDR